MEREYRKPDSKMIGTIAMKERIHVPPEDFKVAYKGWWSCRIKSFKLLFSHFQFTVICFITVTVIFFITVTVICFITVTVICFITVTVICFITVTVICLLLSLLSVLLLSPLSVLLLILKTLIHEVTTIINFYFELKT